MTSSSRMVARIPLRRRLSMEKNMHGIARGHFVSTPLEYAFDHEVNSLPYVIWRLFWQHRFSFAAGIHAWSAWFRRSGLAAIGGTVRYSKVQFKALSAYFHSMASVLLPRHPSCTQSSASARNTCRRVTRRRVSSASGTEAGTASKTHLKLRALSFRFVPKGTADGLCGLDIDENARFETQSSRILQAASCNRK